MLTKQEMYLDYFNNFLTLSRFAEYYNITEKEALRVVNEGRKSQNAKIS